jgi:hypothetical protein
MDAIRNSDDKYRTLESFWKGQVNSKIWLANALRVNYVDDDARIVIYGGWNGVLASILFNSNMSIEHITSVDIDEDCQETAYAVNKNYEIAGRFTAITADMCTYTEPADIVINTSCEHITQEQYEQWLSNQPDDALIVLQSNDYFDHDEHVRCAVDVSDFSRMSNITSLWAGVLPLPKYNRFMLFGYKKES